jgi:hypothetical protein
LDSHKGTKFLFRIAAKALSFISHCRKGIVRINSSKNKGTIKSPIGNEPIKDKGVSVVEISSLNFPFMELISLILLICNEQY